MKVLFYKLASYISAFCVSLFLCFGYAALTDNMEVNGSVDVSPALPDVYITDITPDSSAGITINSTSGTVMFASVLSSGAATFTIDILNISDTVYVFDRVIDGAEMDFEGVYSGTDITYSLSGITLLDEIAPNGGTLSFGITINVPRGVTAENYILKFNFVPKTGTEILPGHDEYNVTLKYNNGQADKTLLVHENDFVPRQETPYRYGYTFTGWYVDTTYTTAWNFDIDRVSGDMTLYAGWAKNAPTEYVVTFVPNNGEASYTVRVAADSLIPLQSALENEGYTFNGWYVDSSCTLPWNFDTDKVISNMTLYAGWEIYVPPVPPDCNITFKSNNGEPDTTIVVLTGEFIPRPQAPVKEGYTFNGWYIDEACTVAWNFEANKVENHTVLYGGWELAPVVEDDEYTVTFKPNNGTADTAVTVASGSHIPRPETPIRAGYTFVGWYTDSACTAGWNFDTDYPTSDMTLYAGWEKASAPSEDVHGDFLGLVEALLSDSNNCLNHSNIIFNAVMESLTSKKRPKEDAPILHCSVNSVSGGTMSAIASFANAQLTDTLQFIFEVDPDPAYQQSRMRLYMYYEEDIDSASTGDEIPVYMQIVSRGADGVWHADGTYIGVATVGNFFGGGNAGKDVKTINPYTWKSSVTTAE